MKTFLLTLFLGLSLFSHVANAQDFWSQIATQPKMTQFRNGPQV